MELIQIIVLAIVQGVTEFLPISSSAHLILVPLLSDWPDQGLSFDIAVHVGTMLAVVGYFRQDLRRILSDSWAQLRGQPATDHSRLGWAVLLGTIPVGITGLMTKPFIETQLRSPLVIAWATIGFGLLLWWAYIYNRRCSAERSEQYLYWRDVVIIGCAQALALIPGVSRSGITITAGLFCGLSPAAAARFAFLLSIPVIALAGLLLIKDVLDAAAPLHWRTLVLGTVLSAVSAYLCIHYFLRWLNILGMLPFVIYRLLLGSVLLLLFL